MVFMRSDMTCDKACGDLFLSGKGKQSESFESRYIITIRTLHDTIVGRIEEIHFSYFRIQEGEHGSDHDQDI